MTEIIPGCGLHHPADFTGLEKNGYQGSSIDCPNPACRATAAFHSYRDRTAHSLGGPVHCDRAYYYCRSCGTGTCPWDAAVGLTDRRLTPAVERLATLTGGVADSFEKGAEVLAETAGIRLSESTVARTTEAAGRRIAEAFAAGRTFGPRTPWTWYRDATGRTVGYVSIDATGVAQQGQHGEKAEGRMASVGMVFNPLPDRERVFEGLPKPGARQQSRYISGLYPLAEMGPLLRRQAAQVGLDRAEVWVALSDGGAGLEDLLWTQFPRAAAVILDFYHAAEHLGALATAVYPGDEAAAGTLCQQWSRLLRDEGGDVLIAVLEQWSWPGTKAMAAVLAEELTYFRNQRQRMDYPTYQANGWYIGSGAVESACKTVVGSRLKGSGMRWSEAGSHAVCHVRALYRSEASQWQAFWRRDQPNRNKRSAI